MHTHTYTDKSSVPLPRVVIQLRPAVPLQSDLMYIALSFLQSALLLPGVFSVSGSVVVFCVETLHF